MDPEARPARPARAGAGRARRACPRRRTLFAGDPLGRGGQRAAERAGAEGDHRGRRRERRVRREHREVVAIITQAAIPSPTPPVPTPQSPTPIPQSTIPFRNPPPTPTPTPRFTQLTTADCCTNHEWLNEREIGFIDSDPSTGQVGLLALDVFAESHVPRLLSAQIGILSPNGRYLAYPDRNSGQAAFIDQQTGAQWMLNLQGNAAQFLAR